MSIKPTVNVEDAIDLLNEILELDPAAAHALVENRVTCNDALADHASVQVQADNTRLSVGLLGVLNGLFGSNEEGWGPIAAVFDDDGEVLLRFQPSRAWRNDDGEADGE